MATLELIRDGSDSEKAIQANYLYHQIAKFSFLLSLVTFDKVLTCTKGLSDQLQSSDLDLSQAADLVVATKSTLQEFRSDILTGKNFFSILKVLQSFTTLKYSPYLSLDKGGFLDVLKTV